MSIAVVQRAAAPDALEGSPGARSSSMKSIGPADEKYSFAPQAQTRHRADVIDWLLLILPGCIWGASFLFIAEGLDAVGPNGVTFVRIAVLVCVFAPLTLIVRERDLGEHMSRYLVDQIGRIANVHVMLGTEVRELLGIPAELITCATLAIGHPDRPLPTRLARSPVSEIAFSERYGEPLFTT